MQRRSILLWCVTGLVPVFVSLPASSVRAEKMALPLVSKLPKTTQSHGSVVVGSRLYIIGGESTTGWSNDVFAGMIKPDAKIDLWHQETCMPQRRTDIGNCTVATDSHIYVVSGLVAGSMNAARDKLSNPTTVLWSRVESSDGSLPSWKHGPGVPGGPVNAAACVGDGFLVACGGVSAGMPLTTVYTSGIGNDGAPGEWTKVGDLPVPLAHHNITMMDGRLYVWNGRSSVEPGKNNKKVYSVALPKGSSSIGKWNEEPAPDTAVCCGAAGSSGGYGVFVGGLDEDQSGTSFLNFARLGKNGSSDWRKMETDLKAAAFHAVGVDPRNGWVFVSGGNTKVANGNPGGYIMDAIQAFQLPKAN